MKCRHVRPDRSHLIRSMHVLCNGSEGRGDGGSDGKGWDGTARGSVSFFIFFHDVMRVWGLGRGWG